jgi:hypothetical protein
MILAHTPRNTGGDLSKRDFKFAMFVAHRFIDKSAANGYDTPKFEEICEVTYKTLCVALTWQGKWRPKNDEMRGEVTYLEATCERAVDLVMSQLDDKNADKEAQIEKECETEQQLEDNMCDDDIMASYEDAQPQDQEERA